MLSARLCERETWNCWKWWSHSNVGSNFWHVLQAGYVCDPLAQIRRLWGTRLDEYFRWIELQGVISRYLYVCMHAICVQESEREALLKGEKIFLCKIQ